MTFDPVLYDDVIAAFTVDANHLREMAAKIVDGVTGRALSAEDTVRVREHARAIVVRGCKTLATAAFSVL